jgi:ABC-type transport system involved in cytochrome bd biosynthesis fused ATPase/permease subunit
VCSSDLRDSSVILLDEATSSLDNNLKIKMINFVLEVFRDKTVVMITHDPDIIPKFSKVLTL